MDIQWYPGHMTKALREMKESIRLVDLIIEIADARLPKSSRNPDLKTLGQGKSRILLLNKADLAEEEETRKWTAFFEREGIETLSLDARDNRNRDKIRSVMEKASAERMEKNRKKGILNRPMRCMVVGVPNVGKSTFINAYAGKAAAKTGNTPGVTRGEQWIRLNKSVELLDTPGLLWPKLSDPKGALYLALAGTVRREVMDNEGLAGELAVLLRERYPGLMNRRYEIEEEGETAELLTAIALNKGCLKKGGEADLGRAATLLLEDFRKGQLGRITLEGFEE